MPPVLASLAISIGFIHTLAGPDHYLPFVAMARAGKWSMTKTLLVTLVCGVGHVMGSVVLGVVGIALGLSLESMKGIESTRGDLAGWLLVTFGLLYLIWGLRAAIRNQPHTHLHVHHDGTIHSHEHTHHGGHVHLHDVAAVTAPGDRSGVTYAASPASEPAAAKKSLTPWILFTIFVFGPCEALIPVLMVPAAQGSMSQVFWVTALFGITTLATMTAIVMALLHGASLIGAAVIERYSHAAAGAVVLGCGLAIKLGL